MRAILFAVLCALFALSVANVSISAEGVELRMPAGASALVRHLSLDATPFWTLALRSAPPMNEGTEDGVRRNEERDGKSR
jgi:hypothetical protein